jgi:type IV pilus assembly protein PilM
MVTRGKRITKLADMPLDISLSDISGEEKDAELVAKIKLLFKTNKISTGKIILGLSGLHCLTRPVVLPELPKTMLNEAITREAKRVLPVPMDQLYISWQIISTSEGKTQVFMVAIPRHIADTLVRILSKAGFKPYLMDIKPIALSRVSREANAIIVDIQPKEFDIIIMSGGIPQTVRTVSFPREHLNQMDRLSIIRDELKRTIQFYNSNNPENLLQPDTAMLVSGELLDEAETMEFLARELGYKVSLLLSPLKCLKQLDPSHHLANVGLALKELAKEAGPLLSNINTLPLPYQPKQISRARLVAVPAAVVAVGLLVLLFFTVQNAAAKIEKDQSTLESTRMRFEQRQAQKKELVQNIAAAEAKLASLVADRNNYTAALESMSDRAKLMNGDLEATIDNVVTDLELYGIGRSGTQVNLSGQAATEQEIMKYVRKLQDTGRFSEITISTITRISASDNSSDVMSYTLALKLPEGEQ